MSVTDAFQTIENCLMTDPRPSERLRSLAGEPWFGQLPFAMLLAEQRTGQSPVHHPEGSVWEHTLLVVDAAAARKDHSADPRAFMWAALLHDIGKPETTRVRKGRITAYDHDKAGARLARAFLSALTGEAAFTEKVARLVRYHMHPLYAAKALPFADIPEMKARADVRDVALLGYCDRLGRKGADPGAGRRAVIRFLQTCGEKTDLPWLRERDALPPESGI